MNDRTKNNHRTRSAPVRTFISFAPEDEKHFQKFRKQLAGLERQGLIQIWTLHMLLAGSSREEELLSQLAGAELVLMLVSDDFMESSEIQEKILPAVMKRRERGEVKVVPIRVRPVHLEGSPLEKLQALPSNQKDIVGWTNREKAWLEVVKGIRDLLHHIDTHRISLQQIPPISRVAEVTRDVNELEDEDYDDIADEKPVFLLRESSLQQDVARELYEIARMLAQFVEVLNLRVGDCIKAPGFEELANSYCSSWRDAYSQTPIWADISPYLLEMEMLLEGVIRTNDALRYDRKLERKEFYLKKAELEAYCRRFLAVQNMLEGR